MSGTVQATFAATLVDEWARAGVAHAVVAPGSRSTPLALALSADGRVAVTVHLDERSAGFVALGLGAATGLPAVVLTTSGTATAELHAAVLEASHAGVPLLVCTADRPPELHHVGAPQTVAQAGIYGRAVRWDCDPGVADAAGATTGAWRSIAARAVAEALGPPAGPVHLNLAFRDPLVASPGPLPPGRPDGGPWHRRAGGTAPAPADLERVAAVLAAARGVIVAGRGVREPTAVHGLARSLGWPVLADPLSGCRVPAPTTVAAADALLRVPGFAAAARPEAVLRLGAPPASKVLASWLAGSGARQVAIDGSGAWLDPERTAEVVVAGDPTAWCEALAGIQAGEGGWLGRWAEAEAAAQSAIDAELAAEGELTEPFVARTLAAALPAGADLVVASSMPVRDVEWYARPREGLRVLSNRGANGIDGVVSTAAGVALAGAPTAALVGDLAFLHDASALTGLAARRLDLTLVVVDNRGGGIFSFLPQASALAPERFEELFGTPHDLDLAVVANAYGLPVLRPHEAGGLPAALEAASTAPGTHVVLAGTDRSANVGVHDRLHAAVAAALAAGPERRDASRN